MAGSGQGSGPRVVFAERFALLYAEAGDPPLKKVTESVGRARRTDERGRPVRATAQRVSDWRRGRNVPARFSALSVVLEVLIGEARKTRPQPPAAGLYDLDAWRALWEEALASPASAGEDEDPPSSDGIGVCPYRGLAAFQPEDSSWFFGRERSTAALVSRLGSAAETGGIVMLVGASGAGKSSLVRAGVIPSIQDGALAIHGSTKWPSVVITPGADPVRELVREVPELADILDMALTLDGMDQDLVASGHGPDTFLGQTLMGVLRFAAQIRAAFAAYAERHGGDRVVIVIDQFEEAFTLSSDENRVQVFVQALHVACTPAVPGGMPPAVVLVGVRADFYGRCLAFPELADALQDRQMVLGPMTSAELREAVSRPAKAAGLQLEPGLIELMLRDLGVRSGRAQARAGQGAYDAGALPLLSHALLATWQRRQAGKLTIAGYRSAGGIQGAVAATAERAWAELAPDAQQAARPLLLRLVRVGEDTQDTRRRSTRHELVEQAANRAAGEEALEVLARARLVTLDAGSVEITHEALLQAWPRLRSWIDQDREGQLLRQRLEEDAATWSGQDRDSSLLYRGARLETARHWADAAGPQGLTGTAQDFLAVSMQSRRRAAWGRRAAVACVVVLALIAATAAVLAVRQRDDAVFRQVVAEADRLKETDPSLSAQLALVAHRMRPDDRDVRTRLLSTQTSPLAMPLTGHTGPVYLTSFSPDGKTLATASFDQTVRLWDLRDPDDPKAFGSPLAGHTSWVTSAVFSPDGRTLATAGDDKTVRLWDVGDPERPRSLGEPLNGDNGTIYLLAFTPDSRTLVTANGDNTARLWDVSDPAAPKRLGEPLGRHTGQVRSVAFNHDGTLLATGGDDRTVVVFDMRDRYNPRPLGEPVTGFDNTVRSLAFSPDGRVLASGSEDHHVRLFDMADPALPKPLGRPLTDHTEGVWSVAFSPGGRVLAAAGADGTTRMWNITDPARAVPLGEPLAGRNGIAYAVSFSPDGASLATGSHDAVVRLWSLPRGVLVGHSGRTVGPRFTPDGHRLVSASEDHSIRTWDTTDPRTPESSAVFTHGAGVWSLALSDDGRTLATVSDKTVRLWDFADPDRPRPLGEPIAVGTRYSSPVAFRPDGKVLVTGHDDESVQLWDIEDRERPKPLGRPLVGHGEYVHYAGFTPDGNTLVTAGADQTVRLWDVDDPATAQPLGQPLTGHTAAVRAGDISPDGRTLATAGDDRTIRLWDLTAPSRVKPIGAPLSGHVEGAVAVAFSPDGQTLASGGEDRSIRLWDVHDLRRAAPLGQVLTGHDGGLRDLAFGPDGRTLASTSSDSTVRVWDLDLEHSIGRICAKTKGVLPEERWSEHLPQLDYEPPCP
ncbi:WD40 repeat protein/energy-coupling factor transporter ATP-binding protein EcfA2 [Saccharothrix ecbatanensis]|uniref:WD40 repeat protein/energy-coupling factor transporter ATP-binding protein EcfA2 n=1 Tax=Saccharothrix ecbatanensis TaxID=1105145 RepID=A0A7W9M4W0_9PSEU|nr:WD40 repeat domain-containing protein [Saccharothrix ecbatanensis]MBB5807448.1 WD40 repeat protein/energy-coupling factor transporter ATP-binding protein EcfA2 [Saccharothrix ecbatanensis]